MLIEMSLEIVKTTALAVAATVVAGVAGGAAVAVGRKADRLATYGMDAAGHQLCRAYESVMASLEDGREPSAADIKALLEKVQAVSPKA